MKKNYEAVIRIIKQLNYILTFKQKKQAILVFTSMIVLSFLELLGISSIYPILSLITDPNDIRDKWYIGWIYTIFPNIQFKGVLVGLCIVVILVFLTKNVFAILLSYIQFKFATDFQRDESTKMLNMYMRRPYEFFVNTNSSIISRGILVDVMSAYEILICIFQFTSECFTILLISLFLFLTDPVITMSALIIACVCFFFIVYAFKGKMKAVGKLAREANMQQTKYLAQAVHGIKDIFVLNRRKTFVEQYESAAAITAKASLTNSVVSACPDRIIEGICISGFMLIVCSRLLFSENASAFIPVLGTFAMGTFKLLPSISKISSRINTMVYYQFGLQSCYDNVKEAERIETEERINGVEIIEERDVLTDKKNEMMSGLRINNICWRYMNSQEDVLSNLSMEIHKGESVAFIGSSGSGKTTLADIIMGLLKPQSGEVLMDGTDIFKIPNTWHNMIGYVSQIVYLIDDTIRANVAFGLPDEMIDEEKVWSALEKAQLKEFVESLPDGLDTIVGERGVKFSGGQRQRVAIARALYEDPDILVLDEATSALDSETETAVMEAIDALQGYKTLIIVAHRLTTIRNCDKIYEITNGKAIERKKEEVLSSV